MRWRKNDHIILAEFSLFREVSSLGINYGQVANNLPPPDQVLALLTSIKISKARIYDTNPQILSTFANSGIELLVTIPNEIVVALTDPRQALQWVTTQVKPYIPATKIAGILVGNEVYTSDDPALIENLVPAMINIYEVLVQLGLHRYILISTANSLAVLGNSYPPSAGSFKPELDRFIVPFLQFLSATGSPFWVNAYPYFAYKENPRRVSLVYALLGPNPGIPDPFTQLNYDNMLYAQVDAIIFAMAKLGYGGIEVKVSETGWPSKGDLDEVGAIMENAEAYNRNLIIRQMKNEGTPLRPNRGLDVYIFALFNEDMKPGPTSERNYGLYLPDGSKAYDVGLGYSTTASATSIAVTSSVDRVSLDNSERLPFISGLELAE